jgi:hypothetical protein
MKMLLLAITIHFVADFLLQSREMGQKKSSEPAWLIQHLMIQHVAFMFGFAPFIGFHLSIVFATYNALVHGVIDWYIWRIYKLFVGYQLKKHTLQIVPELGLPERREDLMIELKARGAAFKYWEDHWFYSTIGFDQLLHTSTLIVLVRVLL